MARVSKLSAWGLAATEPRLRDVETVIWPGDAVVSQEDAASSSSFVYAPLTLQIQSYFFFFSLSFPGLCSLSLAPYPSCVISQPYQAICPPSLIKVQSVFIHLSSRN